MRRRVAPAVGLGRWAAGVAGGRPRRRCFPAAVFRVVRARVGPPPSRWRSLGPCRGAGVSAGWRGASFRCWRAGSGGRRRRSAEGAGMALARGSGRRGGPPRGGATTAALPAPSAHVVRAWLGWRRWSPPSPAGSDGRSSLAAVRTRLRVCLCGRGVLAAPAALRRRACVVARPASVAAASCAVSSAAPASVSVRRQPRFCWPRRDDPKASPFPGNKTARLRRRSPPR